jgi:hypothetical protein
VPALSKDTDRDGAFLAPPNLLSSVATAKDLLEEAAASILLRDVIRVTEPDDTDTFVCTTNEIVRCLILARVVCADGLSCLEDE